MQPARYDITVIQGDTFGLWFRILLPNGTVANPPAIGDGYTIGRLTIRDTYDGDELVSLDTDNDRLTLGLTTAADGSQWSGFAMLDASSTALFTVWGDGVYDLKISDGLHVHTVLFGTARLMPAATEEMPS